MWRMRDQELPPTARRGREQSISSAVSALRMMSPEKSSPMHQRGDVHGVPARELHALIDVDVDRVVADAENPRPNLPASFVTAAGSRVPRRSRVCPLPPPSYLLRRLIDIPRSSLVSNRIVTTLRLTIEIILFLFEDSAVHLRCSRAGQGQWYSPGTRNERRRQASIPRSSGQDRARRRLDQSCAAAASAETRMDESRTATEGQLVHERAQQFILDLI
jgi:hypothetical protein